MKIILDRRWVTTKRKNKKPWKLLNLKWLRTFMRDVTLMNQEAAQNLVKKNWNINYDSVSWSHSGESYILWPGIEPQRSTLFLQNRFKDFSDTSDEKSHRSHILKQVRIIIHRVVIGNVKAWTHEYTHTYANEQTLTELMHTHTHSSRKCSYSLPTTRLTRLTVESKRCGIFTLTIKGKQIKIGLRYKRKNNKVCLSTPGLPLVRRTDKKLCNAQQY